MRFVEESIEFIRIIHADVKQCVIHLNENADFDFWSRAYIRAMASLIEGVAFIYKKMIVSLWTEGALILTTEQQLFFHNLDWRVTKSGEVETTEKKLPTKDGLKSLFVQLGLVVSGYTPDFSGKGWAGLVLFYDIRDALIHPKSLAGLKPEKVTLLAIEDGRAWLNEQLKQVNNRILAILPPATKGGF
jgi:hypothetical protein